MLIRPLDERRRNHPVGLVVDAAPRGILFATLDGIRWIDNDELRLFDGLVYLFCHPRRLLQNTDARQWTGYSWSGGINKLVMDGGPTCYPFYSAVRSVDADERIEQTFLLFSWLLRHAVIPGSVASMSWRLWRSTLDAPVRLSRLRLLGQRAFYGGRQEAPYPGTYRDCTYYDISASYPSVMSAEYPTELRHAGTELGEGVGIARARVTIPKMEWCPLPVRLSRTALCYGYGQVEGFWPWSDLRLAADVGCRVEVAESWRGSRHLDVFGEWLSVVRDGRSTIELSKAVTSRLWSAFGLSQSTGYVMRWQDRSGRHRIRVPMHARRGVVPTAPYIAAETAARVRARLYREGIAGCDDVVYVDTDGMITGGKLAPENVGMELGQWRVKAPMVRCEIKAPQCYRHTCPTCNADHAEWHYTVAGASTVEAARQAFDRTTRATAGYSPGGFNAGIWTFPKRKVDA